MWSIEGSLMVLFLEQRERGRRCRWKPPRIVPLRLAHPHHNGTGLWYPCIHRALWNDGRTIVLLATTKRVVPIHRGCFRKLEAALHRWSLVGCCSLAQPVAVLTTSLNCIETRHVLCSLGGISASIFAQGSTVRISFDSSFPHSFYGHRPWWCLVRPVMFDALVSSRVNYCRLFFSSKSVQTLRCDESASILFSRWYIEIYCGKDINESGMRFGDDVWCWLQRNLNLMLLTQHSIHSIPRLDSDDYDWFFIFCVFHSGEGNAEIILDRFPALLKKDRWKPYA